MRLGERGASLYLLVGDVEFGVELLACGIQLLLDAIPVLGQREALDLVLLLHLLQGPQTRDGVIDSRYYDNAIIGTRGGGRTFSAWFFWRSAAALASSSCVRWSSISSSSARDSSSFNRAASSSYLERA